MNLNTAKGIAILAVVIIVIWILVVFGKDLEGAVSSILTTLGLKKPSVVTGAEGTIQSESKLSADPTSPWSPNLYNNNPGASTLDYQTLVNISDTIYGKLQALFSTDGAGILAQFKLLNNKIDVSNLVVVFQQEGYGDLYTQLEMGMTSQSNEVILQQIITFVNNLPAQ